MSDKASGAGVKPISQFCALATRGLSVRSRKTVNLGWLGKFRAASRGRHLTVEERKAVENQMRQDGRI